MKCPHCLTSFHDNPTTINIGVDKDGGWILTMQVCASCQRFILSLSNGEPLFSQGSFRAISSLRKELLIWPKDSIRPPCPPEVPSELADDYLEAGLVLVDSPKSAAALGRRCLQHLLLREAKVKSGNLANQIQQVIDSGRLPSHLVDSIDAIRNIGNFAAHPMKSEQTGEILDIEPGEAEWTLDVLESLFDFYFVQPAFLQKKRDALNKKLQEAAKPPMK